MKSKFLALVFVFILLIPVVAMAKSKHPISWEPSMVQQTVARGATLEIPVILLSGEDLSDVTLWITPGLESYVEFSKEESFNLAEDQSLELTFSIAIPSFASIGKYQGTVHLRQGKRTLAKPLNVQLDIVENDLSGSVDLPFDEDTIVELFIPGGNLVTGPQGSFTLEEVPDAPFLIQGVVDGNLAALAFFIPEKQDNTLSCLDTAASMIMLTNMLLVPPQVIQELLELLKDENEVISLAEFICSELAYSSDALVNPSDDLNDRMYAASAKVQKLLNQLLIQPEDRE